MGAGNLPSFSDIDLFRNIANRKEYILSTPYRVQIEVVEIRGKECPRGLQVGDTFISESHKPPPDMCAFGYNALFPALYTLRYGGAFPWEPEESMTRISCPDPDVIVVFELRRLDD